MKKFDVYSMDGSFVGTVEAADYGAARQRLINVCCFDEETFTIKEKSTEA